MDLGQYKKETLNSGAVLGWVVMLSMADELTGRQSLVDGLNNNGFDGSIVPKGMSNIEAYRYATTRRITGFTRVNDKEWTFLLRDVKASAGDLGKYLIVEAKDSDLDYGKVGEVTYDGQTQNVASNIILNVNVPPEVTDAARTVIAGLDATYSNAKGQLDYHRTRKVLIHVMEGDLTGFQLHRSVWYVPERQDDGLGRLEQAITDAGLSGVKLVLLPLIDTAKNRELVVEAFRDEATKNYLALIEKANKAIQAITEGKSVRQGTAATLMAEYKRQTLSNQGHIADLQSDVDTLRSTAQIARTAIENAILAIRGQ